MDQPGSEATRDRAEAVRLLPVRWWQLEDLARLDAELFDPDVWSVETFWSELAAPGRTYCVAVAGDGPSQAEPPILGYAGLAVCGAEADVQTIAVAPTAQGRGLGRLLLDWLITQAQAQGARTLLLEVRADNDRAQRLYAAAGFERIAIRRRYYQPGDIDAHIMRRTLPAPARSTGR